MDNPEAPDLYDDRQEDDLLALMNEGDDQESISGGWILTYADLITVLLVLFVMLQTLSDFNVEKFNVLFYGAFGTEEKRAKLIEVPTMESVILEDYKNYKSDQVYGSFTRFRDEQQEITLLLEQIRKGIKANQLRYYVTAKADPDRTHVMIQIRSGLLFQSGAAALSSAAYDIIDKIIQVVNPHTEYSINIRGHTDNIPIKTKQYPSNWELSSIRATNLLRYLIEKGVDPMRLTATGYADLIPVVANDNKLNRAKNRRVEFILKK
ncbi:MAG: OmpA family protein [Gammaproteobacteria bacterium]|nr:OmpA family protein [Gammaproteobacteria bacterium]MBT3845941.1 OmpA family protein [Gammaproteobacteria bacterium]MBT3893552.1 OmpA family protein [Gammaproteobacteria bacterium]MBT4302069.1 OmpA family protein [Gammaproteobacteria bacterium]MBT4549077.1 OmpA family protein [Gammaproteobacteria bacterium]